MWGGIGVVGADEQHRCFSIVLYESEPHQGGKSPPQASSIVLYESEPIWEICRYSPCFTLTSTSIIMNTSQTNRYTEKLSTKTVLSLGGGLAQYDDKLEWQITTAGQRNRTMLLLFWHFYTFFPTCILCISTSSKMTNMNLLIFE